MKKRTFIISLIIPLLVGAISAFITNNQMETYSNLNTPLLAPPGWLFPIVWTLLYILMGISSYFIYISHDPKRENALIVYSFQLFINFCWPLFFFNLHKLPPVNLINIVQFLRSSKQRHRLLVIRRCRYL